MIGHVFTCHMSIKDISSTYCMACSPDMDMMKVTKLRWYEDAFNFMAAMNPDDLTYPTMLGDERPSIEGPYFFEMGESWNQHSLNNMIGIQNNPNDPWEVLCKTNAPYQEINGEEIKNR